MARLREGIVQEHLDEASFLVGALRAALDSPDHTLDEVATGEEERLLAHVDGLVVALELDGAARLERTLAPAALDGGDGAVAAVAAIASAPDAELSAWPWRMAAEASPSALLAWGEGLARAPGLDDATLVRAWLAERGTAAEPALVDAIARRGVDVGARALDAVDADLDLSVFVRLSRAHVDGVRRAARAWPAALGHPDPDVVTGALELAVLAGDRGAWGHLTAALATPGPDTVLAAQLVATLGRPDDVRRLARRLDDAGTRDAVLFALGFAGLPEVVDAILGCVDDEATNPRAAEAYAAITGFDAVAARAARAQPEPDALPPLDDDLLEVPVLPSPDAALPLVDPEALRAHWREVRGRLTAGERYARGRPLASVGLSALLESEPTRRRAPWARELWLRSAGRTHVVPSAPTAIQRRASSAPRG